MCATVVMFVDFGVREGWGTSTPRIPAKKETQLLGMRTEETESVVGVGGDFRGAGLLMFNKASTRKGMQLTCKKSTASCSKCRFQKTQG